MNHATTRTGGFPIGFRLTSSPWQSDTAALARWAAAERFALIDVGADRVPQLAAIREAGPAVGTVDLFAGRTFGAMLSADAGRRAAAVAEARDRIRQAATGGAQLFFTLMLAEDVARPRADTFRDMVASYRELIPVLQETGSKVSVEGWPGANAHCCNPDSLRAFLREIDSDRFGINYDPSHLIRMGIDHVRFLREFASRVVHVHGKDTEVFPERVYEFGTEQAAVFVRALPWGGHTWRYTVPGHGSARWVEIFSILRDAGYAGAVSIELEDGNFNGSPEGEQLGFRVSRDFLAGS